jgi:hypothetical protein
VTQPIIGEWICRQGHHNSGATNCPACGERAPGAPGGVNPIILVSWIGLIFAAPVYPFAGGAAFFGALAVNRIGILLNINALLLFVLLAAATMGAFYGGYLVEKRVSKFAPYRILRDIIRFAVGVLVILNLGSDQREHPIESAEIVGMIVVFPIILFLLKRLDVALKLAGPQSDPDSESYKEKAAIIPDWLKALGEKVSFTKALALGGLAGILGFAFGGGASILTGLLVWVLVTLGIILITGGFAIIRAIDQKLGGVLFKIAIGAPLGAVVGAFVMHTPDGRPLPEGLAIGAVLGPLALIAWGLIARRRRS